MYVEENWSLFRENCGGGGGRVRFSGLGLKFMVRVWSPVAKEFEWMMMMRPAGWIGIFVHPQNFDLIKKLLPLQVLVSS